MPPATPKLALAPDGVPVIQPPPVTKSLHGDGWGGGLPQVIPADDEPKIRFSPVFVIMCKALTVMSAVVEVCETTCSLMITVLPFTTTVWFACPVTAILCPSMTSPLTWTCPLAAAPVEEQVAVALDIAKSAVMEPPRIKMPPVATLMLAAEAS